MKLEHDTNYPDKFTITFSEKELKNLNDFCRPFKRSVFEFVHRSILAIVNLVTPTKCKLNDGYDSD